MSEDRLYTRFLSKQFDDIFVALKLLFNTGKVKFKHTTVDDFLVGVR